MTAMAVCSSIVTPSLESAETIVPLMIDWTHTSVVGQPPHRGKSVTVHLATQSIWCYWANSGS
jgi:hypothetical protein